MVLTSPVESSLLLPPPLSLGSWRAGQQVSVSGDGGVGGAPLPVWRLQRSDTGASLDTVRAC